MKRILCAILLVLTMIGQGLAAVSWVLSTGSQTAIQRAINDEVDDGVLVIYETSTVLATFTLPDKSANTVDFPSAGTMTFGVIANVTASASGTANTFKVFKNGGSTLILTGNVGTADTALVLNTTTIASGDTVVISSFKWTVPTGS